MSDKIEISSPALLASGEEMYSWAVDLFPICRSITGEGVRETLRYIQGLVPELEIHEVASGTKAFDWIVPDEWNIHDAYILDSDGNRIVDFRDNNLHIVGYSVPTDVTLSLNELQKHLYSSLQRPDAIPYVTSYYEKRWGFCLSHNQRQQLSPGMYRAVIDSTLAPGSLTYGEVILPGREEKEILLSTYVCHPSLANNEISGPVVMSALVRWLARQKDRRYSYRIVLIPETIGSIVYISRHLSELKKRVIAGFNLTCIGDERAYTYLSSRTGNTLADRIALHVLGHLAPEFINYSFAKRGSDERQYCSPGVNLPMVTLMRSRFGDYPEYHTSDDDLSVISASGLAGGFNVARHCLASLEANESLRTTICCEPQLSRRNLIPTLGGGTEPIEIRRLLQSVLAYGDGDNDLLSIAEIIGEPVWKLAEAAAVLKREGLVEPVS